MICLIIYLFYILCISDLSFTKKNTKMRDLLLQVSVLMILNGLLAECSLLEKLQTRLREKFKGNFPYGV